MSDDKLNSEVTEIQEPKAKQILSEFAQKQTLIERMTARLRPLRPPVCTSRRLFDYFEIPDPYHPIDYNKPYKPEVGPTKLILGENRRPVAPHAKVPELKPRIESNKPKAPQAFRPQGIPSAATREPSRTAPTPRPPQSSHPAVQPKPNQKPEFGQRQGHAVAKLPVRPDLGSVSKEPQNNAVNSKSGQAAPINRSIPKPASVQKSKSGNMRMRRSTITNTQPVVKQLNSKPNPVQDKPSSLSEAPTAPPVNRSPTASGGGLDDLFGFGNQEGRMRIPKATKQVSTPSANPVEPAPSTTSRASGAKSDAPKATQTTPPMPVKPVAPINRSPSAASGGGGLDDLFGFGNQEGRMKIPRAAPKNQGENSKPRPIYDKNPIQKPSGDAKK